MARRGMGRPVSVAIGMSDRSAAVVVIVIVIMRMLMMIAAPAPVLRPWTASSGGVDLAGPAGRPDPECPASPSRGGLASVPNCAAMAAPVLMPRAASPDAGVCRGADARPGDGGHARPSLP